MLTFFILLTTVKNLSLFLNSDKQKGLCALHDCRLLRIFIPGKLQKKLS